MIEDWKRDVGVKNLYFTSRAQAQVTGSGRNDLRYSKVFQNFEIFSLSYCKP
jgi:hypothetical protein